MEAGRGGFATTISARDVLSLLELTVGWFVGGLIRKKGGRGRGGVLEEVRYCGRRMVGWKG